MQVSANSLIVGPSPGLSRVGMIYFPTTMGASKECVIAIDIGGTKIAAGVVDRGGKVYALRQVLTKKTKGPKSVIAQVRKLIDELLHTKTVPGSIRAIGIITPGPINRKGIVLHSPNLPGWKNVDLRRALHIRNAIPIHVENDANGAAMGEYLFGAGKGADCLLYITVSTGIGCGIILNGKIFQGATGSAGEMGHITIQPGGPRCGCGKRGCVEALASGTAIARIAGRPSEVVAESAREGDRRSIAVIRDAARALGFVIGNTINLMNPDRVVIGGGVGQMGELFLKPMRQAAHETALATLWPNVKIVQSRLGNRVGVLGAAAICFSTNRF